MKVQLQSRYLPEPQLWRVPFEVLVSIPQKKRLKKIVHGLYWCPKVVTNLVGPHPKSCNERSKEKESVIARTLFWCPNVGFLHIFNQDQFDARCPDQSVAQYQGQWRNPSLPDGHSTSQRKTTNQILCHPWLKKSISNNVTYYVVSPRLGLMYDCCKGV